MATYVDQTGSGTMSPPPRPGAGSNVGSSSSSSSRGKGMGQIDTDLEEEQKRLAEAYAQYQATLNQRGSEAHDRAAAQYQDAIQRYRDFMNRSDELSSQWDQVGRLSPAQQEEIRGYGGFKRYADTGGMSDAERQNYRQRSNATVPSFYENLRQRSVRDNAVGGGVNPGFDAQQALLSREAAQGASRAGLETETDLQKIIDDNTKWGIGGVSDAGTRIAQLLQSGDIARMTGKTSTAGLNLDAIRGMSSLDPNYDLPYDRLNLDALNSATGARSGILKSRVDRANRKKNWWDSWGSSALGGLTSIASLIPLGGGDPRGDGIEPYDAYGMNESGNYGDGG